MSWSKTTTSWLTQSRKKLGVGTGVLPLQPRIGHTGQLHGSINGACTEARVASDTGKMKEEELENVMMDLMDGEINVLVCTTIIETGLDVPNVNTIIIENAGQDGACAALSAARPRRALEPAGIRVSDVPARQDDY